LKKAGLVPVLLILALSLPLAAQLRTGQVQGRIADAQGKPLTHVRVTLSRPGTPDLKARTTAAGIFRFPSVFPGPDYTITADLVEYKVAVRSNVAVAVGGHVTVNLVLEPGKVGEEVKQAVNVPMVDAKMFSSGRTFGSVELQSLPTARDPWVIAQLVPGVLADRENIGGNESSQQTGLVAKGDNTNGAQNAWSVDGIDVTDPYVLGLSDVNFDYDALETITVTTGGAADVSLPARGLSVSLLTRRGGNKLAASARFFLTDNAFQASNMTADLRSKGLADTNRIEQIRDYGASFGGPIIKNKVWFWGAYGVQDLFTYTIYDQPDRTLFGNFSFKLDAQPFRGNRIELLSTVSQNEKYGANASVAKPEGDHRRGRYDLGSPLFKAQIEQSFGNAAYLSAKLTSTSAGAMTRPMLDEAMTNPVVFDVTNGVYVPFSSTYKRSWDYSEILRSGHDFELTGTLYKDSFLGLAHEFKGGLVFSKRSAQSVSGYPQNYEIFRNFNEPLIDFGEGLVVPPSEWQKVVITRENRQSNLAQRTSAYLQDIFASGRFTFQLGLRYDYQQPSTGSVGISTVVSSWSNVFYSTTMTALSNYIPSLAVDPIDPRYEWSTWSPRIGVSWDLKGDGRTVLKLSLAQYGDVLAAGANTPRPLGLTGSMSFWWKDADADSFIDTGEMYWQYSSAHAEKPNQLYALLDDDSSLTAEANAALEGDFESDAYLAGNYKDYAFRDSETIDYDSQTTLFRSDIDPNAKNGKTSPRTREIMLSLEKELRPNLSASLTATFRRYDNFDWAKYFYPANLYPSTPDLVIDNTNGPWYVEAGTIPESVTIDEETVSTGDAGLRTWYLPSASFPGDTPFRLVDKSSSYRTYLGLDLIVTKRLADRWFLNAAVTLQDQRAHWGDSYLDPTNKWAIDGQSYVNVGGSSGNKVPAQMFARWVAKLSAMYQMPLGFNVSATFMAREGWRVPNYLTLAYEDPESWSGLYRSNTIYLQPVAKDRLPVFANLSLRLEKMFNVGSGRLYAMLDIFNVMNSAKVNRVYDAYYGIYYVDTENSAANPYNRLYSEIINPRVMRLGVRFEF
jgi:Carboxypeptidase regulatory-like domain